jgi:hypothetical protein
MQMQELLIETETLQQTLCAIPLELVKQVTTKYPLCYESQIVFMSDHTFKSRDHRVPSAFSVIY